MSAFLTIACCVGLYISAASRQFIRRHHVGPGVCSILMLLLPTCCRPPCAVNSTGKFLMSTVLLCCMTILRRSYWTVRFRPVVSPAVAARRRLGSMTSVAKPSGLSALRRRPPVRPRHNSANSSLSEWRALRHHYFSILCQKRAAFQSSTSACCH